MNWQYYLIALTLTWEICAGQNLVPNPSFEVYTSCPTNFSQLSLAAPWIKPLNTGTASPDYYNECNTGNVGVPSNISGYQYARTGVGYAGIYTYGYGIREYIQVQLLSPLTCGFTYEIIMYVSPGESHGLGVDGIGIFLSQTAITGTGSYNPLPYIPQIKNQNGHVISDTSGWTMISGYYTAIGGEAYITIGNFIDDANTQTQIIDSQTVQRRGYYFIDDVSAVLVDSIPDCDTIHTCPPLLLAYLTAIALPGSNNGAMTVTVSGGEPPYLYSLDSLTFQSSSIFTSLALGTYQVYVTDNNGCTGHGTFTINETNCNCENH